LSISADVVALLRWDAPGSAPDQAYVRLQQNPAYPLAARAFAQNMLSQATADHAIDGILKDAGRHVAAKCLAYLHVTGGLTLPRLKALCESIGFISPGRVRALLLYLRYLGYAEPSASIDRNAPRLYLPTQRFLTAWRVHTRGILQATAVAEPAVSLLLDALDAPGVFDIFVRNISEGYLEGLRSVDVESPFFTIFMHRYAGAQIVHAMVTASTDGFPPQEPLGLTASDAARRFAVSRAHVRRMLSAAQREGMLRLTSDGAIILEPAGRDAIDHIYATQLIIFLVAAARTLNALPELIDHRAVA
jgi:hypothetical protein